MTDRPDFFVECITADRADRALGLGFAIETTPEVATACGASEPGETADADAPEDVVEAYLHPYGDAEALDGGGGRTPISGGHRLGSRPAAGAAERSEAYYR